MSDDRVRPTDFELDILKILWERGPSTARAVLDSLPAHRRSGYTTVLKMLQVMEKKEMVEVDRSARSHVYAARIQRERTVGGLVDDLVDRVFDGAAADLLVRLVEGSDLKPEELDALEARIAEVRKKETRRA